MCVIFVCDTFCVSAIDYINYYKHHIRAHYKRANAGELKFHDSHIVLNVDDDKFEGSASKRLLHIQSIRPIY